MPDNGDDDESIVLGLVSILSVVAVVAIIGVVTWIRNRLATDEAERIQKLIETNRANARPGMEHRDDELLQRAEARARARRAP